MTDWLVDWLNVASKIFYNDVKVYSSLWPQNYMHKNMVLSVGKRSMQFLSNYVLNCREVWIRPFCFCGCRLQSAVGMCWCVVVLRPFRISKRAQSEGALSNVRRSVRQRPHDWSEKMPGYAFDTVSSKLRSSSYNITDGSACCSCSRFSKSVLNVFPIWSSCIWLFLCFPVVWCVKSCRRQKLKFVLCDLGFEYIWYCFWVRIKIFRSVALVFEWDAGVQRHVMFYG